MSEETKKSKPTREKQWGRWAIIQEVRFPDHFKYKTKIGDWKKVMVSPATTKAVALELAQWDEPGKQVYKSVEYMAHNTHVPEDSVYKALRVLKEHKLLRRDPRGLGQSKLSVLDWNALEKLREPFRGKADEDALGSGEPEDATEAEDGLASEQTIDAPASTTAPAQTATSLRKKVAAPAAVVDALLALEGADKRLPRADAGSLARGLVKDYGEDWTLFQIGKLSKETLLRAWNGETRNPAGYLRDCINKCFREWVRDEHWVGMPAYYESNPDNPGISYRYVVDDTLETAIVRELRKVAGPGFVIGDFTRERPDWGNTDCEMWLPVTLAQTSPEPPSDEDAPDTESYDIESYDEEPDNIEPEFDEDAFFRGRDAALDREREAALERKREEALERKWEAKTFRD
jgi:hypothetical protein